MTVISEMYALLVLLPMLILHLLVLMLVLVLVLVPIAAFMNVCPMVRVKRRRKVSMWISRRRVRQMRRVRGRSVRDKLKMGRNRRLIRIRLIETLVEIIGHVRRIAMWIGMTPGVLAIRVLRRAAIMLWGCMLRRSTRGMVGMRWVEMLKVLMLSVLVRTLGMMLRQ